MYAHTARFTRRAVNPALGQAHGRDPYSALNFTLYLANGKHPSAHLVSLRFPPFLRCLPISLSLSASLSCVYEFHAKAVTHEPTYWRCLKNENCSARHWGCSRDIHECRSILRPRDPAKIAINTGKLLLLA